MSTKTPRTDAFARSPVSDATHAGVVSLPSKQRDAVRDTLAGWADFARQLECEHAELVAALEAILAHPRTDYSSVVFMPNEVAKAKAALAKVKL